MAEPEPEPQRALPKTPAAGAWRSGVHFPNPPETATWSAGPRYPNPPDPANPDPATLREQWLFATRRYSRWYSRAWGAAALAALSFFALGRALKGSNPIPSHNPHPASTSASSSAADDNHHR
ncbi:uncharacterized protein LOC109716559 isoform X2 [Ananas comosus]|nr:uncharacterized protein LOC109716559 isoform X2 [Ananas comosus]